MTRAGARAGVELILADVELSSWARSNQTSEQGEGEEREEEVRRETHRGGKEEEEEEEEEEE